MTVFILATAKNRAVFLKEKGQRRTRRTGSNVTGKTWGHPPRGARSWQEVILAFNWFFGKKRDKDAVEKSEESPAKKTTFEPLRSDAEVAAPEEEAAAQAEEVLAPDVQGNTAETVTEESAEESSTADPLLLSEEPAEAPAEAAEAPALELEPEEAPVEDAPVEEVPAEEAVLEEAPAEDLPEEIPAEEVSVEEAPAEEAQEGKTAAAEEAPVEEIPAEYLEDDIGFVPVAAPEERPAEAATEPAEEQPAEEAPAAEGEQSFVMDDDYLRAFMEEGAIDDYIYSGTFEERQEALDRIADNAETLAEEGTELLEQKEKEEAEKQKEEPRYNENGELLDEHGKVVLKRSFENKLILADTRERRYYNRLKNELLSYEGVKSEMQTATEVFRRGKQVVARLAIAGFTRIYFALDPNEFDVDRYKQADQTSADFEDAKMLLRVRDDDEFAIAAELIAIMMGALNVNRLENPIVEDYLPAFPRREDAVLEKKGKMLSYEEKDEQLLLKEKRAEERKAAGISEEVEEAPAQEEEAKEEPLVILPLTLENKLHQTVNTLKLIYSKLKNELLSYKSVKSDLTTKNDNFKVGKKIVARMTVVADSVRLYLALDPKDFSTRKYKHKDASDQPGYEGTLLMMKISGEKERLLSVQLITELMKKLSLERNKRYAYVPFAEKYPYIKNGVFKGDEDKPRVKHEGEEYADIYGELTEHLRSQMGSTDAWGVPKGYTAEDGLTARDLLEMQRSKAKTINAGVALATPIVFFYDAAINEDGQVQYLNVQQVLNDKFLGKMVPQEYFAMAEGSSRIEGRPRASR